MMLDTSTTSTTTTTTTTTTSQVRQRETSQLNSATDGTPPETDVENLICKN